MRRLRTYLLLSVTFILVSASLKPAASEGFVICSGRLCSQSDVVCRISPSGFSIACADYYQAFCQP